MRLISVDVSGRVALTCRPLSRPALLPGAHEALPALLLPEAMLHRLVDRLPLAPRVDRAGSSTPRRSHRG